MLSAFQAQSIHELKQRDKSKIESLLAYGDRLLVGLNTGSLRIYRINDSAPAAEPTENGESPSPAKSRTVELLREEEKFSRKPVQQLAIVKEANTLVSLSDGYISLHDLQTYQLNERLEQTKGATYFTVTSNVVKDAEIGVPSLVSRLAVAVKRKVLVWTWRDMEAEQDVREVSAEAAVKSLTWVTGSRLVVGTDPGFAVLDLETGEMTPVYKPTPTKQEKEAAGELAGVRFGAVSSSGMGYMGMASWVPKPMATALSKDVVLLAKDVNTLFTDTEGKALEKRQIPWSLSPEAVGYSYPYLLALQPPEKGTLQIRNPDTLSLLQTLSVPSASILHVPQPNISLAHAGKGFLVASDRTIWRMNALPYDSQLNELVGVQRYDEAISLLNLLEDTLIDDKTGRIREIKTKKGEELFRQQKYQAALDMFMEAEASPERVVALYPKAIAGELSSLPEPSDEEPEDAPESVDKQEAEKAAPMTPQKGMLARLRGTGGQSSAKKDSDSASIKPSTPTRTDTDNMSVRTKATPAKAADKPLEGDDLKFATRCLTQFLADARRKIQKYLTTDGNLKQDPPELDIETGKPEFANLLSQSVFESAKDLKNTDWQNELLKTAQLVDTTLFRAYMLASPSLAGPLFRLDNFCDPDVVQNSLYENDRYNDLIDFLHGKKLHRQALEMLSKFGKGEADNTEVIPDNLMGPRRTVAYLKQLPPELVDLVLEFVRWPIEQEPDTGMEVFLEDSDNAERLPRERVLRFLADVDEKLEMRYLEHIIGEWSDQVPEHHQRLVDLYLGALKRADVSDEQTESLQSKLEDFLRKSKVYSKASTFRQLPADNPRFYESRAIVLSAMGNHKQALSIYVYNMTDYAKAEDYCNQQYLAEQANQQTCLINSSSSSSTHERKVYQPEDVDQKTSNIFAILLGLYLRPPGEEEKRWPQALDLLSRHGARLPASSTLELMPDDLAVQELYSYFQGRIRHATSTLRLSQITRSLEAVRRSRTERHLMLGDDKVADLGKLGGRNRRVRVSEEDHCPVCHKRFQASAIRVYPDDTVVHYGCVGRTAGGGGGDGSGSRRGLGLGGGGVRGWG
ncbi:Vacuolar sorting protein 39 domain 1 [Teratosphaeria destructans]|uniref:Vacuolar sorting protein 39 domain 1 n=1 Tax=Teratosphaeria destructans TaxID=418781 RepID=A0A9W7SQQ7_9PEZI|nr:Vacuolar sorting protein 39 domain 1 [Teratosphaeria destructans]